MDTEGVVTFTRTGIAFQEVEILQRYKPIDYNSIHAISYNSVNARKLPKLTKLIQETLKSLGEKMETNVKEIILLGDFNNIINWESLDPKMQFNSWSVKLLEIIKEYHLP